MMTQDPWKYAPRVRAFREALSPSEPGDVQRARILQRMDASHCGGCGQEGLCEQIEQSDERFPHFMWLCGECRRLPGACPGEHLWQ